jgi:hypothetical protein
VACHSDLSLKMTNTGAFISGPAILGLVCQETSVGLRPRVAVVQE